LFVFLPAALPAAAEERATVDELNQPALQEAFRVLKQHYIRPEAFSYEEINRAALDGLLRRLSYGAELVFPDSNSESEDQAKEEKNDPLDFYADLINADIAYIRFASYTAPELPRLDEALQRFQSENARALILDLRVPAPDTDLETTARLLDRFVQPNRILFKVQRPQQDRPRLFVSQVTDVRWKAPLVVLIDSESCCAAELIAGVLRREKSAFLVGASTPGLTVEFDEVPLRDGVRLRFAVAEILLADDTSLFRSGLTPDFALESDLATKHKVFAASEHSPLTDYLFDRARPRMNEAALVQETDPELDYHVARSKGELTVYDRPPLQDRTLQRAVDLLMTVHLVTAEPNIAENSPGDGEEP